MNKISQELEFIIKQKGKNGAIYLSDFTNHFGDRSISFVIALLALPIALPFTPPGVNTPFALVCIVLAISLAFNKKSFVLPGFLKNKKLPFKPEGGFFKSMTKLLTWLEIFIRPRLPWVTESKWSKPLLGFGILCASVVMLIPLPIINSLSSIIVLLIALSTASKDGLIAIFSSLAGVFILFLSLALVSYGFWVGQNFFA